MIVDLELAEVQRRLGLPEKTARWLEGIVRPEVSEGLVLPGDAEAREWLERLEVEPTDRAEALAARPDPVKHPELWWVLERIYREALATMGDPEPVTGFTGWPGMPASTGDVGRYLYVWLYLAVLPEVRRYHADRGIPDDVSWETLAAVGGAMGTHRFVYSTGGLGLFGQWGLPLRFRGADFQLGRLDFNRGAVTLFHRAYGHALNVHIPPIGRLDPAACDESFARAREFFARHFPEEPLSFFVCHSWLLDPQLADYLPETSNLIRFQRRFQLLPCTPETDQPPGDKAILEYVFDRHHPGSEIPPSLLDKLPQDTTLRRAYVTHLRSGGHWHSRSGWFAF